MHFDVVRVDILGTVAHPVEGHGQEHAIEDHFPVKARSEFEIFPDSGVARFGVGYVLVVTVDMRLGNEEGEDGNERGETCSKEGNDLVAHFGRWYGSEIDSGCYEVAQGVALLQESGEETTSFGWHILEGKCRRETPDSTHEDSEECTNTNKAEYVGAKAVAICKADRTTRLKKRGHFCPKMSARMPMRKAPSDRNRSVKVTETVMADNDRPYLAQSSVATRLTALKSWPSVVHVALYK